MAREVLGGALILAGAKQMHVDAELVEGIAKEHAIAVIVVEQYETERVEIDLVGLRGEVVLLLQEIVAVRDHLLAAAVKLADSVGKLLELHLAGATHVIGLDHQRADVCVGRRGADRRGHIPEQGLWLALALHLAERALERLATELLDDVARGTYDQRGLLRQSRAHLMQRADDQTEKGQQQQQVQHSAQCIEAAPHTMKKTRDRVHRRAALGALYLFFDARRLTSARAQIIELGAAHAAAALDRDLRDARAIGLERAFHTLAVRDLAHGERGVEATIAARNHDALVGLDALAIALDHFDLYHDRIAGFEFRYGTRHALGLEGTDDVVHSRFLMHHCASARCCVKNSASNARRSASSGIALIKSGRRNQVRPTLCWRRQRSMAA